MPVPETDTTGNQPPYVREALEPDYRMLEKIRAISWKRCAVCGVLFQCPRQCNCGLTVEGKNEN